MDPSGAKAGFVIQYIRWLDPIIGAIIDHQKVPTECSHCRYTLDTFSFEGFNGKIRQDLIPF